jgi:hypothetical protein
MTEKPVKIDRRPWSEFRDSGLLWWVNRGLHLFGWALVYAWEDGSGEGEPDIVYPARVPYKGFGREQEEAGFERLEAHLRDRFKPPS